MTPSVEASPCESPWLRPGGSRVSPGEQAGAGMQPSGSHRPAGETGREGKRGCHQRPACKRRGWAVRGDGEGMRAAIPSGIFGFYYGESLSLEPWQSGEMKQSIRPRAGWGFIARRSNSVFLSHPSRISFASPADFFRGRRRDFIGHHLHCLSERKRGRWAKGNPPSQGRHECYTPSARTAPRGSIWHAPISKYPRHMIPSLSGAISLGSILGASTPSR